MLSTIAQRGQGRLTNKQTKMVEERSDTIVEVPEHDEDGNEGEEGEVTADSEKPTLKKGFSFTKTYQMPQRHTKVVIFYLFLFIFGVGRAEVCA